jgi:hypothetical protein
LVLRNRGPAHGLGAHRVAQQALVVGRRLELAETLAARAGEAEAPVSGPRQEPAEAEKGPAAGTIVPRWHRGAAAQALAPGYRRIVELVESHDGEGISAKELTARMDLALVPAKIEGVRSKAKRLAERGWLTASPSGRFMPRQSTATDPAAEGPGGGRGAGS